MTGWVQERGQFHALADLLAGDRLTYLTAAWDRTVYDSPSAGASAVGKRTARTSDKRSNANAEVLYRTIGRAVMQGRPSSDPPSGAAIQTGATIRCRCASPMQFADFRKNKALG